MNNTAHVHAFALVTVCCRALAILAVAALWLLASTTHAQLAMTHEYVTRGADNCAYSNTTWAVRLTRQQQGTTTCVSYHANVTGVLGLARYRLVQRQNVDTNWSRLFQVRSDSFGFVNVTRTQRIRQRDLLLGKKSAAVPQQLALTDPEGGVVAAAQLAVPVRKTISGPMKNTGADASAIGSVSFSVSANSPRQFRLFAAGQSSAYTLWINDLPYSTHALHDGTINLGEYPDNAPALEDVVSFGLSDETGRLVLTATLGELK